MTIWIVVVALSAGSLALKTCGPLFAGGRTPPAVLQRVINLLTPALLASLVITGAIGAGHDLVVDARLAGVGTGLVVLLARKPLVVALLVAVVTTVGLRYVG